MSAGGWSTATLVAVAIAGFGMGLIVSPLVMAVGGGAPSVVEKAASRSHKGADL